MLNHIVEKLRVFASKQKWILTELKYLNMLGFTGALGFFCDALQAKTGTIFISRTSGTDIGNKVSALFIGQAIMASTSYVVVQGIAAGMSTLCSQAYGATNYKLMGTYFMRALIIASLTCFPIWTIWISVKPVIYYITQSSELAQGAGDYASILCFSYPAYIYSRLACSFLQSQNIVFPNLAIQISGNLLNICLQYIFVVVFPLEIKGVALSYTISNYLIAILLLAYIQFTTVHLTYSIFSWSSFNGWYHYLKYGMAGTLQFIIDVSIGRIVPLILFGFILKDTDQLALLGILNVFFVLLLSASYGLGAGANIRIGNLLGENNLKKAKKATIVAICYELTIATGFAIVTFSFSHYIAYIFTSVQEFRNEIEFGIRILTIAFVSDIECCLKGICNACCLQNFVIISEIIWLLSVATPLGCALAYFVSWKAAGYYLFLSIGYLASAISLIILLFYYDWQKIAKKVSSNISQMNQKSEYNESSHLNTNLVSTLAPEYSCSRKCLLISRYLIILAISCAVFMLICYIYV